MKKVIITLVIVLIYIFSYGAFRLSGVCVYTLSWNNHVNQEQMLQDTDVTHRGINFSNKIQGYSILDVFYIPMKKVELILRPYAEPLPLYEGYTRGHLTNKKQ